MKIIGLTGSIATGKSFVANVFRKSEIKVFSSDAEIANLLKAKEIIEEIKKHSEFKSSISKNEIDKNILSHIVFKDINALIKLEEILHPCVEKKMKNFLEIHKKDRTLLLEIPLLFENKRQSYCHKIITTYCDEKTQRERALRRKNIDSTRLNFIMKRQIPSKIKAALTDYLVYTGLSYEFTAKQLEQIFIKEEI